MLDRLLDRLHRHKAALLRILERPEIPLHTNGSEDEDLRQARRLVLPISRGSPRHPRRCKRPAPAAPRQTSSNSLTAQQSAPVTKFAGVTLRSRSTPQAPTICKKYRIRFAKRRNIVKYRSSYLRLKIVRFKNSKQRFLSRLSVRFSVVFRPPMAVSSTGL